MIEGSGGIARGQADLGEAEEVGGDELMFFDLASKDQLKDLARRLLVAKASNRMTRGGTENFRSGCSFAVPLYRR